jgi:hypothetical protein
MVGLDEGHDRDFSMASPDRYVAIAVRNGLEQ